MYLDHCAEAPEKQWHGQGHGGLWKRANLQGVMESDKRTRVDLGQHGCCVATQCWVSILKSVGL
jgi:hypothetical protein